MHTTSLSIYIQIRNKSDNRERNIAANMGVKFPFKKEKDEN